MEPNNTFSSGDGKTAGIVSYFTIIGWLVAFFAIHKDHKTALGSYQLRQTLLFHIISMVTSWLFVELFFSSSPDAGLSLASLNWILRVVFFVLWLIGFIGAINGEEKPIPLIGEKAQTVFSSI